LFDSPAEGYRLQQRVQGLPNISLINSSFDRAKMRSLMSLADIYASPHCSEGFGLTIAEAMALGKAVVATDYSGSRDFLDNTCGYPVSYSLSTLAQSHGHYTMGNTWAKVDEADLSRVLRQAAQQINAKDFRVGAKARERIRERLSPGAVSEIIERNVLSLLGV
jgi:glycosyltransferase involved in cell wall biosynthesis